MSENDLFLPSIADGEDKSSILANCIRKNYRHIRKWAKRTKTNCFRIYDRDIKQYPLAIDFYDGKFCVQYFAGSKDSETPAKSLQEQTIAALKIVFEADSDMIFWRVRTRRKSTRQYEKKDDIKEFFTVLEYGLKFQVNLIDYLDTGLFLDHRETRRLVASISEGKRVLNLFAYTCSFSVHAAAAGAVFTKSVDMSNTYTDWGKENFRINSISTLNHPIIRADCLKFIDEEIQFKKKYDVIVIDPPTISRSKKMDQLFDIHIDYVDLLSKSLKLLEENGVLFFSTNSRKFVFDPSNFHSCSIVEITSTTIPSDFHDKKIHRCWKITRL